MTMRATPTPTSSSSSSSTSNTKGRSRPTEPRSSSSCAACKLLKRRCAADCIFAPHFRSDESKKFAKVHKVFGASNVSKILAEVAVDQREDAVNSLAYEAEARLRDPVHGCIGAIAHLQRRMAQLQHDLSVARSRLARARLAASAAGAPPPPPPPPPFPMYLDDFSLAPPPPLPDLVPLCAGLARSFEEDVILVSDQRLMDDLSLIPFDL